MLTVDVYDAKREIIGGLELLDEVFAVEFKPYLLHEVIVWQLAKRRQGNACTKSRHEVHGGGRKPWRQKGTGRARSGSRRNPLWRGGGVIFGSKPRNYFYSVPKKVKKAALRIALSNKFREKKFLIFRDFALVQIKTKDFIAILNRFEINDVLIITAGSNRVLEKSARNVSRVKILRVEGLNVYDLLRYDYLMVEEAAVLKIEKALS